MSEGKENLPSVGLYRAAYGFKVLDCADSASFLESKALELSRNHSGACFAVYLDIAPDNAADLWQSFAFV